MREPYEAYNRAWLKLEAELQAELDRTGRVIPEGDLVRYCTILHEGDLPGDQGLEWWTQKDWDRHAKHVEELKAKGIYGKPWICDLSLKPYPEFDNPIHSVRSKPMESYRYEIIDFAK
jgi:hypothetical protein